MTRLVASLIVRNELGRYLRPAVTHLLSYCDEIRVLDDGSSDGSREWLESLPRVEVCSGGPRFDDHEGAARDCLLDWTLNANPTHVLAIDADEFVSDPAEIRRRLERRPDVPLWTLEMQEVWRAEPDRILIREDGGWHRHPVSCLYAVPEGPLPLEPWTILDRALACGREPVWTRGHRAEPSRSAILHFGWANEADRRGRYDRYATLDGGRYHAGSHLQSILLPDDRIRLLSRPWPVALHDERPEILARSGGADTLAA